MTAPVLVVGSSDTLDVRLTLDVSYSLNGESADDIITRLTRMCDRAIGNGMLSGDNAAEVDEYTMEIVRVDAVADIAVASPPA